MDGKPISFGGNNLQTANILTQVIDHHSGPMQQAPLYGIAHANRSVASFKNYPTKPITVSGILIADSIDELDALIDTFNGYFIYNDNLDIGHNGGVRRYYVQPRMPIISRPEGLTKADFTVVFDCLLAFGHDILSTTLLTDTGRTLGTYADVLTFNGNAPYQYPIFTITYTAITGGTSKTVNIGNNANGQQVSITRTWATNDVLQIDVQNTEVTVNGTEIDPIGGFPIYPPGAQTMGYSDGFTTRTFNINVTQYAQWL